MNLEIFVNRQKIVGKEIAAHIVQCKVHLKIFHMEIAKKFYIKMLKTSRNFSTSSKELTSFIKTQKLQIFLTFEWLIKNYWLNNKFIANSYLLFFWLVNLPLLNFVFVKSSPFFKSVLS